MPWGIRQWGPRRPRPASRHNRIRYGACVGVCVSQELYDQIKVAAYEESTTMSEWIRDAIERKLKEEEE